MKNLISNKKLVLPLLLVLFTGFIYGSHYYQHSQGYSVTGDTGFSIPEYNSQAEIATELVAPFLFLVILLKLPLEVVLGFVYDTNDSIPGRRPDVSKEASLMSITITAMLIPTPFWRYIRLAAGSIGLIATVTLIISVLFLIYLFFKG